MGEEQNSLVQAMILWDLHEYFGFHDCELTVARPPHWMVGRMKWGPSYKAVGKVKYPHYYIKKYNSVLTYVVNVL